MSVIQLQKSIVSEGNTTRYTYALEALLDLAAAPDEYGGTCSRVAQAVARVPGVSRVQLTEGEYPCHFRAWVRGGTCQAVYDAIDYARPPGISFDLEHSPVEQAGVGELVTRLRHHPAIQYVTYDYAPDDAIEAKITTKIDSLPEEVRRVHTHAIANLLQWNQTNLKVRLFVNDTEIIDDLEHFSRRIASYCGPFTSRMGCVYDYDSHGRVVIYITVAEPKHGFDSALMAALSDARQEIAIVRVNGRPFPGAGAPEEEHIPGETWTVQAPATIKPTAVPYTDVDATKQPRPTAAVELTTAVLEAIQKELPPSWQASPYPGDRLLVRIVTPNGAYAPSRILVMDPKKTRQWVMDNTSMRDSFCGLMPDPYAVAPLPPAAAASEPKAPSKSCRYCKGTGAILLVFSNAPCECVS